MRLSPQGEVPINHCFDSPASSYVSCWQILLQKSLAILVNDDSVALTRFAVEAIDDALPSTHKSCGAATRRISASGSASAVACRIR